MSYSLKQAAQATGRSKPTILRAIQRGKLPAKQDERGRWQIQPAALKRVFHVTVRSDTCTVASEDGAGIDLLRNILIELRELKEILIQYMPVKAPPAMAPVTAPLGESDASTGEMTLGDTALDSDAGGLAHPDEEQLAGKPPEETNIFPDRAGKPDLAVSGGIQNPGDRHGLETAKQLLDRGDVALAERRYADAAEHFNQAAAAVPDGHPAHLADCLDR